jgi:hypothetical protein
MMTKTIDIPALRKSNNPLLQKKHYVLLKTWNHNYKKSLKKEARRLKLTQHTYLWACIEKGREVLATASSSR